MRRDQVLGAVIYLLLLAGLLVLLVGAATWIPW